MKSPETIEVAVAVGTSSIRLAPSPSRASRCFPRTAKQACCAGQYRNHARLRATAYLLASNADLRESSRARREVRRPIQGRVRRHPGTDGAAEPSPGGRSDSFPETRRPRPRIHSRNIKANVSFPNPATQPATGNTNPALHREDQTEQRHSVRAASGSARLCVEEAFQVRRPRGGWSL